MNPEDPIASMLGRISAADETNRRLLDDALSWTVGTESFEAVMKPLTGAVDVQIEALDRYVGFLNEALRPAQQAAVEAQERILEAFAPSFDAIKRVSESISAQINADRDGWERQLRRARFEIALDRRRRFRSHLIRLRCNLRRLPDTVPAEVVEALAAVIADVSALCTATTRPSRAASPLTVHVQRRRPLTRNLCPHAPPVAAVCADQTTTARYSTTRPPGD